MAIKKTWWGSHKGQDVFLFTISNGFMELAVANFGGTIASIMMPGAGGSRDNMVLGYDALQGYIDDPFYMGCIVGRFANRISNAAFSIGHQTYRLAANEPGTGNHLHGGVTGFNKKVFSISEKPFQTDCNAIQFHYSSPDGEEGYPGNLEVDITYTLTDKNEVIIDYKAITDQTTPVNLTSHCYFNLSGSKTIATEHELFISGDSTLVSDEHDIPTGEIKEVNGTRLDFRKQRRINDHTGFNRYNDCYILNQPGKDTEIKATLTDRGSGRRMVVKTTLPGLMLYTADHIGPPFKKNQGICLEAQFFPDSPNHPHFPTTLLYPGNLYQHTTIYQFNLFYP